MGVLHAAVAYALVMAAVVALRPGVAFDKAGGLVPFGAGEGESLLSLGVISALAATACAYASCWVP